jgi:hypothetical protein
LKNGFEKLEKEKEKEIHLHSDFGPTQPQPAASACPACGPLFSPAPVSSSWAEPKSRLLARLRARAVVSRPSR